MKQCLHCLETVAKVAPCQDEASETLHSGWISLPISLTVGIVKEIAPSHAVRKLGPLCSNAGAGLGGSESNSLDELLIFIVLWHLGELEVDGGGSAHEESSNGLFLHI